MANFSVSWIFTAKNRYSKEAKKIAADSAKISTESKKAAVAIASQGRALGGLSRFAKKAGRDLSILTDKFKKNALAISRSARNIGAGLSLAVTAPIVLIGRSMIDAASDAEEGANKFAVVFKAVGSDAEAMSNKFAATFGVAESTAKELFSNTGDLLTGFGFEAGAALDISNEVQMLAADLASFSNFKGGTVGASEALTKALLGERESMKALGVVITEAGVKAKILSLQKDGLKFKTLAEAKAVAALRIAQEQSKNAIGDTVRTMGDFAAMKRRAGEATKNLSEKFGKLMIPMAKKLTGVYLKITDSLASLSPESKKAILIFAGILAVVGPLLLIIGSIGLALPLIATGIGAIATAFIFLAGPVGILLAIGAGLTVIIAKSDKARTFIGAMSSAIGKQLGPTAERVMKTLGKLIDFLSLSFGGVSTDIDDSTNSLQRFADVGEIVGDRIGAFIRTFVEGLELIGVLIEQIGGTVFTLDTSNFDAGAIESKSERLFQSITPDFLLSIRSLLMRDDAPAQALAASLPVFDVFNMAANILPPAAATIAANDSHISNVTAFNSATANTVNNSTVAPMVSPQAATASSNATLNGSIKVSASEGSKVDSVSSSATVNGTNQNFNMGAGIANG